MTRCRITFQRSKIGLLNPLFDGASAAVTKCDIFQTAQGGARMVCEFSLPEGVIIESIQSLEPGAIGSVSSLVTDGA